MVLTASMLLLVMAAQPRAEPAFAPEVCGKSTSASCETARAFVAKLKGRKGLVAFKAARLLYLFENGQPIDRQVDLKEYDALIRVSVPARIRFPVPMALSSRSVGHKLRLGDARTPEGEYRICERLPGSEYTFFLSISFPGPRDVEAAVRDRRFEKKEIERIEKSQHPGACPDFRSALGGTIGIHGAPTRMASEIAKVETRDPESINVTGTDWTLGCLGVENRHIRFLAKEVKVGTPILIVP